MIYIITEEQNKRLVDQIIEYFDKNLTPFDGWQSPKKYKSELKENDGEVFIFIDDVDTPDDGSHMWYSIHTNPNVSLKKEDCPLVLLPDGIVNSLSAYFGEGWKPLFIEWFQNNTGLKVKKVDNFGWGNQGNL